MATPSDVTRQKQDRVRGWYEHPRREVLASMKPDTSIGNEATDTNQVELLKNELAEERAKRKDVESQLATLKEDFGNYREAMSKKLEGLKSELTEVRSTESGTSDPQGESTETTTPLEDIADDEKEDPPGVQVGPSVTRAAAIMSNWETWSKQAPKGRTIRDGLKQLIETATGESLAWKQVYRACRKVEQLTKGKIVLARTKRHGNVLLQPSSAGGG